MSKEPCCLTGFKGDAGEFLSLTIYSIVWCNLEAHQKHY